MVSCVARPQVADDEDGVNHVIRILASAVACTCFALTVACSNGVAPSEIPTPGPPDPTPEPKELSLPADDASHDAPIEWWYYNGHLESEDGAEYSFHFVIFQTQSGNGAAQFEFGQAGITDLSERVHTHLVSDGFGSGESNEANLSSDLLELELANFSLAIASDGTHSLSATDDSAGASIWLQTDRPREVMLHEGGGWMDWPFGWTYYYSYPRMRANGTLALNGEEIPVSGEIWFDHQWGDFFVVGKPAGWQWFALHMNNGDSLMVSEVRDSDGDVVAVDGTLTNAQDGQRTLDSEIDGIWLETTDHWTSSESGGVYPAGWRLRIGSIGFDAVLVPSVADQEVPAMPYGNKAAAYWEGRVDVLDASSLEAIGVAFAELSGYVEPEPLGWRR